jgi:hypothetical protein
MNGEVRNVEQIEDNIEMYFREISCMSVVWIGLAQNAFHCQAFVKVIMNLHVA